jgi:hypothetical protein
MGVGQTHLLGGPHPALCDSRSAFKAMSSNGTRPLYAHASGRNTWLEMSTKTHKQLQFGVLPCRVAGNGQVQVMLLTSRETGRWSFRKAGR